LLLKQRVITTYQIHKPFRQKLHRIGKLLGREQLVAGNAKPPIQFSIYVLKLIPT